MGQQWHLQLRQDVWVRWGYGPPVGTFAHIAPSVSTVSLPEVDLTFTYPFELPAPYAGSEQPQEYERVSAYGWRFRSENLIHDTGWHLAGTREQALTDAHAFADTQNLRTSGRDRYSQGLLDGLNDIREG